MTLHICHLKSKSYIDRSTPFNREIKFRDELLVTYFVSTKI